jgi:hypothetical protein
MKLIKEAKRFQELAGINEIKISNPRLIVPKEWTEQKVDPEPDPEEDIEIKSWSSPMEGWDENHTDNVHIYKTPDIDPLTGDSLISYYYVRDYAAFGGETTSEIKHNNYKSALEEAIKVMKQYMENWDDNEY